MRGITVMVGLLKISKLDSLKGDIFCYCVLTVIVDVIALSHPKMHQCC